MRVSWAPGLLIVGTLAVGCGSDDADRSSATPTALPSEAEGRPLAPDTPHTLSVEERAERRAERKAKYEAEVAERCDPLLPDVTLTYRITATATDRGTEIGLRMSLANRSEHTLYGSTGGDMNLEPGPSILAWGGSSADELQLNPGTVTRRPVWHERLPPGTNPLGDRVTSFRFYTGVYAPKPGGPLNCALPAKIVAPRGLVDGHAAGRWTQASR